MTGGPIFAAVTDVAFTDQTRTVWYQLPSFCSGLLLLREQELILRYDILAVHVTTAYM